MSTVLVAETRSGAASCARLESACIRLGLDVVRVGAGATPRKKASLVIAGLAAGERSIPTAAVELAERAAAPLLLVAGESLVRPTVLLDEGRVLVAAPDASDARIEGAVRMLLAEGKLGRRAWTADLGAVTRTDRPDGSTTVAFDFGEIAFDAAKMIWTFRWPEGRTLLLSSPVRLPHSIDVAKLAREVTSGSLSIAANVGDLVFGCSASFTGDVAELLAHGGPALRARLVERSDVETIDAALTEVV